MEGIKESGGIFKRLIKYVEFKSGGWVRYFLEEFFNAFLGWIPWLFGMFLRWIFWRILIKGNGWVAIERGVEIFGSRWMKIGRGVYIGEKVILQGRPGELIIQDEVRIMPGAVLNVYNYRGLEKSGIELGRGAVIGIGAVITGQGRVEIGEDVIIAPGVKIMPVNHNYLDVKKTIKSQGITADGIRIGRGSWIGAGAVVLDGVELGEHTVIGAQSVVSKSIPEYSLAMGNPAEVIRKIGRE